MRAPYLTTVGSVRLRLLWLEGSCRDFVENASWDYEYDDWAYQTQDVIEAHDDLALGIGLPPVGSLRDLQSWAASLHFKTTSRRGLATWLAHVDVVRSVHDWRSAVLEPLDCEWPQNLRPNMIDVPASAWTEAAGRVVKRDWIGHLVERLHQYEAEAREDPTWARRMLQRDYLDLVAELPALLAAAWVEAHTTNPGQNQPGRGGWRRPARGNKARR